MPIIVDFNAEYFTHQEGTSYDDAQLREIAFFVKSIGVEVPRVQSEDRRYKHGSVDLNQR
jgi:hypothetical protein